MPHCYSYEVLRRRRDRAIQRGYIEARPEGQQYMLVETRYRHAMIMAYRSIRWHDRHDRLANTVHHHARLATRCAKQEGLISDAECKAAAYTHREAGRLKHGVSKWRAKEHDELFAADPWAGKTLCNEHAAVSRDCSDDPWSAWQDRSGTDSAVRGEAVESRCDDVNDSVLVLMDVIANEAFRSLLLAFNTVACSIDVGETETSSVETETEGAAEEYECGECTSFNYEADIQMHEGLRQRFVREWECFVGDVTYEAEGLARCMSTDEGEYWNDLLQMAERISNFTEIFGGAEVYLNKKRVIEIVGEHLGEGCEVAEEVELLLRRIGHDGNAILTGAWVCMFGFQDDSSCVDEQSGGVDSCSVDRASDPAD